MKKPITLDCTEMIGLNTIISSHGKKHAEAAYIANTARVGLRPELWAIRYFRLYLKYAKENGSYIDVTASKRALLEA